MREIEMAVDLPDDGGVTGTLVLPDGDGPHPAVLLLWAGRVDRDGNRRAGALGLGPAVAGGLAARGIASYRYDRTGTTDARWRAMGFYDHREVASAALAALAARPEVRGVGLLGHSEGALHALGLAARNEVDALVLLSCPARSGKRAFLDSVRHWTPADLPRRSRLLLRVLRRTAQEQITREVARAEAGDPRVDRSLREFVHHDPCADLAAVRVPVLALTGEKDITVDPDDLAVIADLVAGEVSVRRVPDLTHLLRRDPGVPSREDFRRQLAEPVDQEVVAEVAGWLAQRMVERVH
ncbi:alpha/beta hydrolase [Actinokineospora sp. PR83]|uniref:alpha/beta hydrolase n=1 Tax=Actinokineospora sp. PR83 TaxID=2884908 RepID=UPI001F2FCAC4|nr:alpha/beta hydrolase [Actinokineospora sp. PR83]MCG8915109.1 alpha/beta hydrolase [Actinokineospora sp. PR83]